MSRSRLLLPSVVAALEDNKEARHQLKSKGFTTASVRDRKNERYLKPLQSATARLDGSPPKGINKAAGLSIAQSKKKRKKKTGCDG